MDQQKHRYRDWGQGENNGVVVIWAQRSNSGPQSVGKTAYKINRWDLIKPETNALMFLNPCYLINA